MNAISGAGFSRGFGANAVIQLGQNKPVCARGARLGGDEVILEAVRNAPRVGETRPIAALLPQVLAQYGLADSQHADAELAAAIDLTV
jgi:hypothetical protein